MTVLTQLGYDLNTANISEVPGPKGRFRIADNVAMPPSYDDVIAEANLQLPSYEEATRGQRYRHDVPESSRVWMQNVARTVGSSNKHLRAHTIPGRTDDLVRLSNHTDVTISHTQSRSHANGYALVHPNSVCGPVNLDANYIPLQISDSNSTMNTPVENLFHKYLVSICPGIRISGGRVELPCHVSMLERGNRDENIDETEQEGELRNCAAAVHIDEDCEDVCDGSTQSPGVGGSLTRRAIAGSERKQYCIRSIR